MTSPPTLGGDAAPRLFAALRLPPAWAYALAAWQHAELLPLLAARGGHGGGAGRALPGGARLVAAGSLHVTLAFLGERPAAEVPVIAGALREAVASLGGAPVPVLAPAAWRETRSVGMVVLDDEDGRAAALAGAVQERLAALGVYRCEPRPWLPHVTVLRFRERPRLRPPLPAVGPCSPSDAALYHSLLRSGGAQYAVVDSVALGGCH